jgi:hypothetical protein
MPRQYWRSSVPPLHIASGTALNTSTALTDISPLPPIVIPGNQFDFGATVNLRAVGEFSTTGTPTLLLGFYLGGVAGAALAASGAITTTTTGASWPWILEWQGRIRALGTSGSVKGQGKLYLGTSLTAFALSAIPITAAARTVTWDTTAAKSVTVGAQWGTSSASNTVTCDEISVELLS